MKERYLQSVRVLMDCPAEERERLVSRLGHAVSAYLDDVPDAAEADLIANFGTPEECAARLMQECPTEAVTEERRRKARLHRTMLAVLSVLLAAALGIAAYLWANGGLVIIRTEDPDPDFWDNLPSDGVIYNYDD